VFGSDLSLGSGATDRVDELFECVSKARLVLEVFALPGGSGVAEWTAGDQTTSCALPCGMH
jgi:hypothetical protein